MDYYTFMMDGCAFWSFKNSDTIQCNYKAGKSQHIIKYNSNCVQLKEESHTHLG